MRAHNYETLTPLTAQNKNNIQEKDITLPYIIYIKQFNNIGHRRFHTRTKISKAPISSDNKKVYTYLFIWTKYIHIYTSFFKNIIISLYIYI